MPTMWPRFVALSVVVLMLAACSGTAPAPAQPAPSAPPAAPAAAPAKQAAAPAPAQAPKPAAAQPAAPAPAAKPAAPASKPASVEKVKFVGTAGFLTNYLPVDAAQVLGYLSAEGIEAEVTYVQSGARGAAALISGSADFGGIGFEHGIKAQLEGQPLVFLVAFAVVPGSTLLVSSRLQGQIKTVADLKGRKVAVPGIGSGNHALLLYLLGKQGMKGEDLDIIASGIPAMVPAMETGQVDAAVPTEPATGLLLSSGKAYVLVDLRTLKDVEQVFGGGRYLFTGLATRPEMIKNRPEVVQRVVNSVVRASRYIATTDNEELARKMPQEATAGDPAKWLATLRRDKVGLSPDGQMDGKDLTNVIEVLKTVGSVKSTDKINVDAILDNSWAKRALAR